MYTYRKQREIYLLRLQAKAANVCYKYYMLCICLYVCIFVCAFMPKLTHISPVCCYQLLNGQKPTATSRPQKRISATQKYNKLIAGSYESSSSCRNVPYLAGGVRATCFAAKKRSTHLRRFTDCWLLAVDCRSGCLFISCS